MKKYIKFDDGEYFRLVDINFDEFSDSNLWSNHLHDQNIGPMIAYKEYKRANRMVELSDFETIDDFNYEIIIIYDIDELEEMPIDVETIDDLYNYYLKLSKIKPVINVSD